MKIYRESEAHRKQLQQRIARQAQRELHARMSWLRDEKQAAKPARSTP